MATVDGTPPLLPLPTLLRLALRDMRGGLRGFAIFLACIALGVAAIVGVGSVARALSDGLAREGRVILGGDVSFALIQRQIKPDELAWLAARGSVSQVGLMRAMARRGDGEPALVEIKAVDASYPASGSVQIAPDMPLATALAQKDGVFGIVADASLAARLDLKTGDRVFIGDTPLDLRATLVREPDKLAAGIGFGPRVLMSEAALQATGLVQPGSLVRWLYRVALASQNPAQPADEAALARFAESASAAFPEAGWEVRTRKNVSPQFAKNLERFTQFLTLVGLTALIVGGVGVANAVRGYVDAKQATIATLKSLGATGQAAFAMMLAQVMLVAAIGIGIGAMVGAALPWLVSGLFGPWLPFPLQPGLYPGEIAAGFAYGTLTALAFALAPLGRAHDVPVSALFRDAIDSSRTRPRRIYLMMVALAALALVATILALSADRRLSAWYMLAVLAGFILLRGVARGLMWCAAHAPKMHFPLWRLALANIHRPGALTPSVVLSLGLGLALLVALALIDGNIRSELDRTASGQTPSFFFVDIQGSQAAAFEGFLHEKAADAKIDLVPMMRGRLVKLNETRAEDVKARDNVAWVLEGDRGITFSAQLPAGSKLTAGEWWPGDYSGPPLVSMEAEIAAGLGLKLGDNITVNVLGRNVTAKIANLRIVNWRSLGINFVMIFSPNTFAGAPHSDLATLTFAQGDDSGRELALLRDVARAWPGVTSVRVKDALEAIGRIVAQLAFAIRGASSVALLASVLVLAGALAAGQRARRHDAVVLKVLGMTRWRLMATYGLEYGILGLAAALFGTLAGMAAAFGVVKAIMQAEFVWLWPQAIMAALGALALTLVLGLAGTWRILGQRPASHLRNL